MSEDKHNESNELPEGFDPEIYLELNSDLMAAGVDPVQHYLEFGWNENRIYKSIVGNPSDLDYLLHNNPKTKRPKFSRHEDIWKWIRDNAGNHGLRVLEIGSRSVVSDPLWKKVIPNCEYTGFDVLDGKNVDVIGDVHKLSDYFEPNSFDLVIAFAVFEHLSMPWIAVEEISKVLGVGGHVVIETHFSFSEHELPWHYFQFNSNALEVLFCEELGFQLIDSGLDTPIVGRFSQEAAAYLRGKMVNNLYCHSSIIAKKISNNSIIQSGQPFNWRDVIGRLGTESMYPLDSDLQRRVQGKDQ